MDEISELEQRLSSALNTIKEASVAEAQPAAEQEEREKNAQAEIASLQQQIDALQAKLKEGEDSLRQVENRRKDDLAELDEIIDQLEPLLEGGN